MTLVSTPSWARLALDWGVESDDLAGAVKDCFLKKASVLNELGLKAQLQFLRDELGDDGMELILRAVSKPAFYAMSEHDRQDLPFPLEADAWFWQAGCRWVAVYSAFHEDWWDGADPAHIAERPEAWRRPISEVPTSGTLVFRDSLGAEHYFDAATWSRASEGAKQ